MEIWTSTVGMPAAVADAARKAESLGWDGIAVPYAPTMVADPYVCLASAAQATERIKVGPFVATPASHTPASAAGSIKTLQAVSEGRAVMAVGRGDSALAYLGMAPAPLKFFEAYVARLRNYLQGTPQPFDLDLDGGNHFPPSKTIGLAQAPEDARFGLFMKDIPPVPLDMVATGPKVLGIAARHADRITLAVGAAPDRIAWALGEAKAARQASSIDRPVSFGAWVPVVVTDDVAEGRRMLSGVVTSMARFTAMHGKAVAPVDADDRKVYERVHDAYEMQGHFREGSPQSKQVPEDFFDRFAVIGPPETCIERLSALIDLGIERFFISGPSTETTPELAEASTQLFAEKVMPALR